APALRARRPGQARQVIPAAPARGGVPPGGDLLRPKPPPPAARPREHEEQDPDPEEDDPEVNGGSHGRMITRPPQLPGGLRAPGLRAEERQRLEASAT